MEEEIFFNILNKVIGPKLKDIMNQLPNDIAAIEVSKEVIKQLMTPETIQELKAYGISQGDIEGIEFNFCQIPTESNDELMDKLKNAYSPEDAYDLLNDELNKKDKLITQHVAENNIIVNTVQYVDPLKMEDVEPVSSDMFAAMMKEPSKKPRKKRSDAGKPRKAKKTKVSKKKTK